MKGLFICCVLCLSAGFLCAEEVSFTYQPPAENSIRVVDKTTDFEITMTVDDPSSGQVMTLNMGKKNTHKIQETVLGVQDGRIVKIKVEYLEAVNTDTNMGKIVTSQEPVAGKVYIITRSDEQERITDEQGLLVPVEENLIVKREYGAADDNTMTEALSNKTLTVGNRVMFMEESMKKSFQDRFNGGIISDTTVTLKELRTQGGFKAAVFEVNLLMNMPMPSASMTAHISGEVVVVIDKAWILELEMEGPVTISSEAPAESPEKVPPSLSGSGTMKVSTHFDFMMPAKK
ncbi:MAG: hypothetical protein JW904_00285 [Spirochaetales bacterium]|nr:hypothetical protein [Spirochaetales bacterium]